MIRPPRRSVTRFFIPLIDVLILLFCIFLLMPIVEEGGEPGGKARLTPGQIASLRHELDSLRPEVNRLRRRVTELEQTRELSQLKQLQDRIARLEQEKARAAETALLRHFEIDPRTGALLYYNPDRREASYPRDAAALTKLIDEDLASARKGKQQLIWVFLLPRGGAAAYHPTEAEQRALESFLQQRRDDGLRVRWETLRGRSQGGKT